MRAKIDSARRLSSAHSFFLASKTSSAKRLVRQLSTSSSVLIVAEKPLPLETRDCFVARMQRQIREEFNKPVYKDHLLFMSYFTRLAREHETLEKASQLLGAKKIEALNLGYSDHTLLPGHCLLTVIDSQRKMALENTFSLRPDLKKKPFYKAPTAPDQRLPIGIIQKETPVWPALHTSFEHEIDVWAKAAFYAAYVHSQRPVYPLHFLLKPLDIVEKERYFAELKNLKLTCGRYSLLDHYHPHTGETLGDIVSNQNCTTLFRLFEQMSNPETNLNKLVGNNPTPQLITKVLRECFFNLNIKEDKFIEMQHDEVFGKVFTRSA